jgi:hypothetical protein
MSSHLRRFISFAILLIALLQVACATAPDVDEVRPDPTPPADATADSAPTESLAGATAAPATHLSDPATWPTADPGVIAVDAAVRAGPISPLLFGTNFGPWSAVPFDLLDETRAAGLTLVRWPGGEWGDRNTITPALIDRFVAFARDIGAEPQIHVRLLDGTPEAAAELVRYANVEKGYNLRYWAIGNEPNLYPPDEEWPAERIANDWRAIAQAMLAVDPDIVLMGPEVTGYLAPPANDPFTNEARAVMQAFLRVNGDLVDIVTIHRYPFPLSQTDPPPTVDQLAGSTAEWDPMLADLKDMIRQTAGRDIPVGVTEFNANWSKQGNGEATPDSIPGALWLADVLGRMIRAQAVVGAQFALQSGPVLGFWGLMDRADLRPQFYVYPLYARFGSELVYADAGAGQGPPRVSAYAALGDGGQLTLLVINQGTTAADTTLKLANHDGGTAEVYRLDAERVAAGNVATEAAETAELADGAALSLRPQSVTLYVLP